MENEEKKFPTAIIDLPSKGLLYPEDSPLRSGKVEIKYPTAREEDILTNKTFINQGVAVIKFVESLLIDKKVKLDDMIVGDRNKIVYAARILAYGSKYNTEIRCKYCKTASNIEVDLNKFEDIEIDENLLKNSGNEFEFTLPNSKKIITYKILNGHDEKMVDIISKKFQKKFKNSNELTNRLKAAILSVDGNEDKEFVNTFIDDMVSQDSLAFREEYKTISPNIDTILAYECEECGYEGEVQLPLDIGFFWPSAKL